MLAYYGTKISPHMTDTPEGYLEGEGRGQVQ